MFLPEHFKRALREVSPNPDRRDKIERAVARVRQVMTDDAPLAKIVIPPIVSQGSYAAGTLVRPIGSQPDYDIDFVVPMDFNLLPTRTPDYVLNYLQGRLRNWYATRIEARSKCVRLRYQDGFHIDLVPGRPLQSGAFEIPDQDRGTFIQTDPKAVLAWIEDLDVRCGGRFRKSVILLKRWRDENFGAGSAPSGLHLTVLAGIALEKNVLGSEGNFPRLSRNDSSMEAMLSDLANGMLLQLRGFWGLKLPMPGSVRDDIAPLWPDEHRRLCATRLETFISRAKEAIDTKREDTAIARWQSLFGPAFVANP